MSATRHDVLVIGGGHNGLVAAGLLAKRGRQVTVLERRDVVGGAAVTETPFGPDFKVTALSYVVSLMPPTVRRELELERFGYKVYPQHPYVVAYPDGRSLMMCDDPARRAAEVAKFSAADADELPRWDAWLARLGQVLGPLLTTVPPRLGSKHPRDLWAALAVAWKLRKLDERGVADVTRLMTMSVADLLEERFASPQVRGVLAVSGIIGTWAGPRSPGTAYVMAHHKIGDLGDGQVGAWGFPEGGMGGVTQAMRRAAEAFGATIRTDAEVVHIKVRDGRVTGVVLAGGDELDADVVITTTHPQHTFLGLLDRAALPADFVTDLERWKTRSGTVKINLALDRLPDFTARPGFDPEVHGGTIVLADSLDELEAGFQDAVAGRPAARPFADICIPSVFDPTLAPPGKHVMSMFTQWVPHGFADAPHPAELDAYADRVIARVEALAPGFTASILHRQVIGPHEMQTRFGLIGGNIFHGELSASQLFHLRPAPGYADFRTPIRGLYQASSATHGGGGVTGIPALQVVRRVLKDR
ncbi:MAG: NAD(P)/FAD-dependent oxidoreductase [Kofleriaceae bacterium]|nr:NAD(P)/FAD-dependent oxidoreductase [Myxococcales bacterium]MCB9564285.1 NAD(P)/FAD-dependent oxidoreductase [Kofleriaceae bacterium]